MIDGAAQRLPAQRGIHAVELIVAVGEGAVAARVGNAEIDVGGFARGRCRRAGGRPRRRRCAAWPAKTFSLSPRKTCAVPSRKRPFGDGKNAAERKARVVDAVLAAHQVLGDQRPVDPGQHVVVQRVDLAERGAHLADFELQSGGQRGEGDVSLFQIHALFAEGEEEIGARVGVDDFLEADFAFVHFERRACGVRRRMPAAPMKSPITLMSGLSTLAAAPPAPPRLSEHPLGQAAPPVQLPPGVAAGWR